jgi:putative ATP-dependent endonuclease of the OLD family
MKIDSVRIQNFRAFKDQTVAINNYTCFVGPNGTGKSTVLNALNVIFRNSEGSSTNLLTLGEEDFHEKDTSNPIVITVTLGELSAEAAADFSDYFRNGKLIISAIAKWDAQSKSAPVLQYGERMVIQDFEEFFKAVGDKVKVDGQRTIYEEIKKKYPTLPPPTSGPKMLEALKEYERNHPNDLVQTPSQDQFYGVSRGKDRLQKYIQWIFIPAVKDASSEQLEARRTALGQILERTVRAKMSFTDALNKIRSEAVEKYRKLLDDSQSSLVTLSDSLSSRIQEWAHPNASVNLRWVSEASQAVSLADPLASVLASEGMFEGQLARFGHGFQRSFLLALLQELASSDSNDAPTLILGCEEPELYQHPPQIRHLASILLRLSEQRTQVLICTHSSHFIHGERFEDVRMVRRDVQTGDVTIRHAQFEEYANLIATISGQKPSPKNGTALKIAQTLQPSLNELFFSSVLVLTEGLEDAAYVHSYMTLLNRWDDFRRLGCHIVSPYRGKSNIQQPLAISTLLKIPTFVIFDGDSSKCVKETRHVKDNTVLLNLCGSPQTDPIPQDHQWGSNFVMWKEDIASAIAHDIGTEQWTKLIDKVKASLGVQQEAELNKNTRFIEHLMSEAWDSGLRFPTLEKLCLAILGFAFANNLAKSNNSSLKAVTGKGQN